MQWRVASGKGLNLNTREVGESSDYSVPSARIERNRRQTKESPNVGCDVRVGESRESTDRRRSSNGGDCFAAPLPEMEIGEVRVSRIPNGGSGPMSQGKRAMLTAQIRNGSGAKFAKVANATKSCADRRGISPGLILSIMETATKLFAPEEILPCNRLEELVVEAIVSADGNYGEGEANKWANGYEFPQELVDSDLRLFQASQLDFTQMVRRRLKQLGGERLSKERVERLRQDNPE